MMGKLSVFHFTTLNGFYKGPDNDISWHRHGAEEADFSAQSLESGNTLVFGRITYEMMTDYWSSPMAAQNDPVVAEGMNRAEKIVFSRTLPGVSWNNTTLIRGGLEEEIRKRKEIPGKNMTVLGSGDIVRQLADFGLIDEYMVMVDPVILGSGTPLFSGISHPVNLRLAKQHTFSSGVVLLTYVPV